MNCPACKDAQLVMTERQGVEIDYCPNCRGVWLERGRLDRIIEHSMGAPRSLQEGQPGRGGHVSGHDHDHDHDHHREGHRKKGFLSELFD